MMRPDPVQNVLFDFDGVCADTESLGLRLDREAYEWFGIQPTDEEMRTLVGTTGLESIPAVFRRHGMEVSAGEFWSHRRDNSTIYRDLPLEPTAGIVGFLRGLRGRGIGTALVTTTAAYDINFALNRLGMQPLFDAVITGDMVARHKPNPDPYLAGIESLGASADSCVAIEDSAVGIHAAKSAGLYTLAYVGGPIPQDTHEADEEFADFAWLRV